MAFNFEQAGNDLIEKLPDDRGVRWLVGRFAWLAGGENKLSKEYFANDPDAARVHRLLFEQYAHIRDCPVYPGQAPYSTDARQAAFELAEDFAQTTQLPLEVVQSNWRAVAHNIYPGEQARIDRPPTVLLTE